MSSYVVSNDYINVFSRMQSTFTTTSNFASTAATTTFFAVEAPFTNAIVARLRLQVLGARNLSLVSHVLGDYKQILLGYEEFLNRDLVVAKLSATNVKTLQNSLSKLAVRSIYSVNESLNLLESNASSQDVEGNNGEEDGNQDQLALAEGVIHDIRKKFGPLFGIEMATKKQVTESLKLKNANNVYHNVATINIGVQALTNIRLASVLEKLVTEKKKSVEDLARQAHANISNMSVSDYYECVYCPMMQGKEEWIEAGAAFASIMEIVKEMPGVFREVRASATVISDDKMKAYVNTLAMFLLNESVEKALYQHFRLKIDVLGLLFRVSPTVIAKNGNFVWTDGFFSNSKLPGEAVADLCGKLGNILENGSGRCSGRNGATKQSEFDSRKALLTGCTEAVRAYGRCLMLETM